MCNFSFLIKSRRMTLSDRPGSHPSSPRTARSSRSKDDVSRVSSIKACARARVCVCVHGLVLPCPGGVIVMVCAVNSSSKYRVSVSEVTWGLNGGTSCLEEKEKEFVIAVDRLVNSRPTDDKPQNVFRYHFQLRSCYDYGLTCLTDWKRMFQTCH